MDTSTKLRILITAYTHDKSLYPKIVSIFDKFSTYPCIYMTELLQYAIINKLDINIINMIYKVWKKQYDQYCNRYTEKSYLFTFAHICQCNVTFIPSFTGDIVTFINAIGHEDIDYYRELAKVLDVRFFESDSDRHEYLKNILKI
jgi:hypothetical protein